MNRKIASLTWSSRNASRVLALLAISITLGCAPPDEEPLPAAEEEAATGQEPAAVAETVPVKEEVAAVKLNYCTQTPVPPQLICKAGKEKGQPRHLIVIVSGGEVEKVVPNAKHVCQGDKVFWHANDKDFEITFVKGDPFEQSCKDSTGRMLKCDIKNDAAQEVCHKYSIKTKSGNKLLDPHIIVD